MEITILYALVELSLATINTVKYIVTVKASPFTAAIVSTISAVITGIGTKLLTTQPMWVIVCVLAGANLAGVLIGRFIVDKFTKDRLWVYNATIKSSESFIKALRAELKDNNIHSMYDTVVPDEMYIVKVFSESKEDSRIIKATLNSITRCKYHIIESR